MNRIYRSVARVLLFISVSQPLVSTAEVLRYNYTLYGGDDASSNANLPPHWVMASNTYGDWQNVRTLYECSNWSPSPATVGKGIEFEQSANDCKQDQERWVQQQIKNTETGEIANYKDRTTEYRTIKGTDVRSAVGILENWLETTPTYTPWVDTNALYGCDPWAPSPSGYSQTTSFTQTSNTCETDQSRQRQDREQERYSGEIRDSGPSVTENQTLTGKSASRSYTVTLGQWTDKGAKTGCSNWSPAANTIDLDVEFTQVATDCQQAQERVRNESYIDHKTGQLVTLPAQTESQTLSGQTDTKQLKGTKIPLSLNVSGASNSFISSPFSVNWTGNGANEYLIRGSDTASGVSTSDVSMAMATTKAVTATGAGEFSYTVTAKNELGESLSAKKTVAVETAPTFSGFTVNGQTSITVSPSASLSFAGSGFSAGSTLQGRNAANSSNATLPTVASSVAGTTSYYASAAKTVNGVTKNSDVKSVAVTVVEAPAISSITAPAATFADETIALKWTATNGATYKIRGSNVASGIAATDTVTTSTGISVKPTAAGSYTYTLTVTNAAGVSTTATVTVIVEASPSISSFTSTPTNVAAGGTTTLSWTTSTATSLSIDQSVGTITGTSKAVNVGTTAGSKTYTLTISRTVNGVTRTATSSTTIAVITAPTVAIQSAPATNVFAGSPFTLSWTGANATSFSIQSNNAASGIATTDVDQGTTKSISITPTAAGTYTYTITAKNSVGVTDTATQTVTVEAAPTITAFASNDTTVTVGGSTTLSWTTTGSPSLTIDQSVGAVSGTSTSVAVGTVAGAKTYTLTASKTLNGVTKTATKAATVTVVAAPTVTINAAPATNVFVSSPFTLSWTGTGASSYSIKGNVAASGLATTDTAMGTTTTKAITPTAAGTYIYTITATNAAGSVATVTQTIVVEDAPTITSLTAAASTVTAGGTVGLTWATTGSPTLSIDQSVGTVTGTTATVNVGTTAGAKTFTLTATKMLNGVTKTATKAVAVTVVAAPTVTISTAPTTNVYVGSAFTLGWTATGATSYTIKGNTAASGLATTETDMGTTTSKAISPTAAGTYTYTVTATNAAGTDASTTRTIVVEAAPTITSLTASASTVTAGGNVTLTWATTGSPTLAIDQSVGAVTGTSAVIAVGSVVGSKTYTLTATKVLNGVTKTATQAVTISVIAAPTVTISTAPSTSVFVSSPFTLGWTATGATSYSIRGDVAASGLPTTETAMGTTTTRAITPTAAGTYTYTVTATNAAGATSTATKSITVVAAPTVTTLTASATSVAAGGSVTLTWAVTGSPTLAIDQSVGAVTGTSKAIAVGTVAGAKTYTLTATEVLNGVTKTATKSVTVTVVAAPTVAISSAPSTNVFVSTAFALGWTGTNVTSYTIKGSAAASGVATAGVSLGTTASYSITPTAAGTYVYTITATNSVGVTATTTRTVVVEAVPTLTALTATPASVTAGGSTTLAWTQTNATTMSIDQGVGAVTGTSKAVAVGTVVGAKTYTMTVSKVLNGVTKSASRSVAVTVTAAVTTGCFYSRSSPESYIADTWEGDDEPSNMYWVIDGQWVVGSGSSYSYDTVKWNGYTYYAGKQMAQEFPGEEGRDTIYYQICRK